jgi:hypothetical protein
MSLVLQSSGGGQITINEPTTASNFTQTLPAATGEVMVSGNMPAFHAYQTSGQSFSSSTFTKVTFNNETFDTNSNFASSTFTPTVAGYYQVNGNVGFVGNTVGHAMISIYKNGGSYCQGSGIPNNVNIGGMVTASTVVFFNGTTDFIELYAWQNSGGALTLQTGSAVNTFSATLVRSA